MTEAAAGGTDSSPEATSVQPHGLLPGERLRIEREAQQMSVTDVADVLRFSERQVLALEAGDYEALPGATVVRGFIRAYAKLLKLDPVPLIAALAADVPVVTAEVRPPANMGQAENAPLLGAAVPWGRVFGGLAVVVAIVAGGYYLTTALPVQEAAAPATTVAPPVAVPVAPPAPAVSTGDTQPSAPVAAELPPANALMLEFDDTSWVEVRDVGKKVLMSGEFPKGTRRMIEGSAPLQLWIGKASAVRVRFGEREIDLKPHTHEDVARLSVE